MKNKYLDAETLHFELHSSLQCLKQAHIEIENSATKNICQLCIFV